MKKARKVISIFMIILVVLIPVYSTMVYADLFAVKTYGETNQLPGFASGSENIVIEASVDLSGDSDVTTNQVQWNGREFASCTDSTLTAGKTCLYTILNDGTIMAGTYPITVDLYDDLNQSVKTGASYITIDKAAPTITYTLTPAVIGANGMFGIEYTVVDTACSTCSNRCSGISKLEVYKDGELLKTIPIDAVQCSVSASEQISLLNESGNFTLQSGQISICVKAYDKLGLASDCIAQSVGVDASPPVISNFQVNDYSGLNLSYIGPEGMTATVSVDINDESQISLVAADLSGLNPSLGTSVLASRCENLETTYRCYFENVFVKFETPGQVKFTVTDNSGNVAELSLPVLVAMDITGPNVVSIASQYSADGKFYASPRGTNFTVMLTDDGAGIDASGVRINTYALDGISGYQSVGRMADSCVQLDATNWQCLFKSIGSIRQSKESAPIFTTSIKDRVGNIATTGQQIEVIADNDIPLVNSAVVTCVGVVEGQNYCDGGASINIMLNSTDTSRPTVIGNLGMILPGLENASFVCNFADPDWLCSFDGSNINQGPITTTAVLTVTDAAGNGLYYNLPITILQNQNMPTDYWTITNIKAFPHAIDRSITHVVPQTSFFSMDLLAKVPGAQILNFELSSCSGMGNAASYMAGEPTLIDNNQSKMLVVKLATAKMDVDNLQFNCTFDIISRMGNTVSQIEKETAGFKIEFYSMPMGELEGNIKRKIIDIREDPLVKADIIGKLNKIFTMLSQICRILKAISNIAKTLGGTEVATAPLQFNPFTHTIAKTTHSLAEGAKKTEGAGYLNLFGLCYYVNCEKNLWGPKLDEIKLGFGNAAKEARPAGTASGTSPSSSTIGKASTLPNTGQGTGMPETGNPANIPGGRGGIDPAGLLGATPWPSDPSQSLILSAATGCIPGIIFNLQKEREIKCQYALCLRDSAMNGLPVTACEYKYHYEQCYYVMGQIFQVIPYGAFVKRMGQMIAQVLQDPISMVISVVEYTCVLIPENAGHGLCVMSGTIRVLGQLMSDVKGLLSIKLTSQDSCKEVLKSDFLNGFSESAVPYPSSTGTGGGTTTPQPNTNSTGGIPT